MTDFDFLAAALERVALGSSEPELTPLPADRWVARSALQKAIRRGDAVTAEQAVLTLLAYDSRLAWRALVIIALEDVGFAAWAAVTEIVALASSAHWRRSLGSEADLLRFAARRLASGGHCQAACDLLLRAQYDPAFDRVRAEMADANPRERRAVAVSDSSNLIVRAVAILSELEAAGPESRSVRARGIIQSLTGPGPLRAVAEAAWRSTTNEMALLLPLVAYTSGADEFRHVDDAMPETAWTGGVPAYALDQFTRVGRAAIRRLLSHVPKLRQQTDYADALTAVSDAVFVVEGGVLVNRLVRPPLEDLRRPFRCLPGLARLPDRGAALVEEITPALSLLNDIRADLYQPTLRTQKGVQSDPGPAQGQSASNPPPEQRDKFTWYPRDLTVLDAPPNPSELGLSRAHWVLQHLRTLPRGSSPGMVRYEAVRQRQPIGRSRRGVGSYSIIAVPADALSFESCEFELAALERVIRGEAGGSLPTAVRTPEGAAIVEGAEEALARLLLGEADVIVKLIEIPDP